MNISLEYKVLELVGGRVRELSGKPVDAYAADPFAKARGAGLEGLWDFLWRHDEVFARALRDAYDVVEDLPMRMHAIVDPANLDYEKLMVPEGQRRRYGLFRKPRIVVCTEQTTKGNLVTEWYPPMHLPFRGRYEMDHLGFEYIRQRPPGGEPGNRLLMVRGFDVLRYRCTANRHGRVGCTEAEESLIRLVVDVVGHVLYQVSWYAEVVGVTSEVRLRNDRPYEAGKPSPRLAECYFGYPAEEEATRREEAEKDNDRFLSAFLPNTGMTGEELLSACDGHFWDVMPLKKRIAGSTGNSIPVAQIRRAVGILREKQARRVPGQA